MLNQLVEARNQSKGEVIGTLLSFRCPETVRIPYTQLMSAFELNDNIPAEWRPEQRNQLALYLACITSLNRTSPTKFDFDEATHGFTAEEFGGYIVTRLKKEKDSPVPAIHKIIFLRKKISQTTNLAGKVVSKIDDVQADDGITIELRRVDGDAKSDDVGKSKFEVVVENGNSYPIYYEPFLKTLAESFNAALNYEYGPKQIREIVLEIVRDRLASMSVNGWYFTLSKNLTPIAALEETLNNLSSGINFFFMPLVNDGTPLSDAAIGSIAFGIEDSFLDELDKIEEDILNLQDSESKTRDSTWRDRLDRLKEIQERIAEYKEISLLKTEVAQDRAKEILETLNQAVKTNNDKDKIPLVPKDAV